MKDQDLWKRLVNLEEGKFHRREQKWQVNWSPSKPTIRKELSCMKNDSVGPTAEEKGSASRRPVIAIAGT